MSRHPSLKHDPADLIGGTWVPLASGGPAVVTSRNPAFPVGVVWRGQSQIDHVGAAIAAARAALPSWSRWPRERRFAVLRRFRGLCEAREAPITELIADEVGKVLWDAKTEATALTGKVDITLDDSATGPLRRVSDSEVGLGPTRMGRTWFRPHGVMAVIGPFNFPMHLPNGHIVPALALGNTVVFKPSDKAPACGQMLAELFQEALDAEGAPPGVVNVVQGGADVARTLVQHEGLDGILFTGSWPVGRAIMEANLDRPGRILALEMGGNNAAVVMQDADLRQAAVECVRSAFISTGQRCTCTRRLIVHEAVAERFIAAVCKAASNLIVAEPRARHPVFMGPIISEQARAAVLAFQARAAREGGQVLVPCTPLETAGPGWYLTPGVMRVDRFVVEGQGAGCDTEVFGPLLRVSVARDLGDTIEQANATQFGLAAAIFTKNPGAVEQFLHEARAGCVNVNAGTAGASSKLPFGGLGRSGNHRPAGAFSVDYCAYPVAGMIEAGATAPTPPGMRFEDGWLS